MILADAQLPSPPVCTSTSYRKTFFVQNDSVEAICQFNAEVGKLIAGRHKPAAAISESGFILKIDVAANIQWAKDYSATDADKQVRIIRGIRSAGGQYILVARITSVSAPDYNKTLVIKAAGDGSILWSKLISVDPATDANGYLQLQALNEGPDGSILLCGTVPDDSNDAALGQYGFVMKLTDNGDPMFSKLFVSGIVTRNDLIGIFDTGSNILVFGMIEDGTCPGLDLRAFYTMSLNSLNGDIEGVHRYCFAQESGVFGFAEYHHNYEVVRSVGGFSLFGFLAEGGPGRRDFLTASFNAAGESVSAKSIKEPLTGSAFHNINVDENGMIALFGQKPSQGLYTSSYEGDDRLPAQTQIDLEGFDNKYFI